MPLGKWHLSRSKTLLLVMAGIFVWFLFTDLLPFRKPDDLVQQMIFSPQQVTVRRVFLGKGRHSDPPIASLRRRSIRSYSPRSITLTSNGAPFRAYLLDLSGFSNSRQHVDAFMKATTEIEQGLEPTTAPILASWSEVTDARCGFGWSTSLPFFGPGPLDRMLVVASDADAEVTLRVSYTR